MGLERAASRGFRVQASRTQVAKKDMPAVESVARKLIDPMTPAWYTAGLCVYGALLWLLGSAPALMPHVFFLFFVTVLPYRVYTFNLLKFTFFLVDYCYFANTMVAVYFIRQIIVGHPGSSVGVCHEDECPFKQASQTNSLDARLQAAVYMLAEGPLAGGVFAWQNSWVMDNEQQTGSTFLHVLPGLAMFAHRWLAPGVSMGSALSQVWAVLSWDPSQEGGLGQEVASRSAHANFLRVEGLQTSLIWCLAAPLAAYCLWQTLYVITVQLIFRRFIVSKGYHTSYRTLTSRAAKTNNILNRTIRKGSSMRRVCIFGLLQLAFTLVMFIMSFATYRCFQLAVLWNVAKIVCPLYNGARYSTTKVPADAFKKGLKTLISMQQHHSMLLPEPKPTPTPAPMEGRTMSMAWVPNATRSLVRFGSLQATYKDSGEIDVLHNKAA